MSGSFNFKVHVQLGKLHTPREHRLLFPRPGKSKSAYTGICFFRAIKKAKTSTGFAANAGGAKCLGSIFDIALTNSQTYYPFQSSWTASSSPTSSSELTEVTNRLWNGNETKRKICQISAKRNETKRTDHLCEPNRTVGSYETKRQTSSSWKTKTKRNE